MKPTTPPLTPAADLDLPPLPDFFALGKTRINGVEHGHYSASQMQKYARDAIAASRRAAKLPRWIDDLKGSDPTMDAVLEYFLAESRKWVREAAAPSLPDVAMPEQMPDVVRIAGEPEESLYRRMVYKNGWNACLDAMRARLPAEGSAQVAKATYSHDLDVFRYTTDRAAQHMKGTVNILRRSLYAAPERSDTPDTAFGMRVVVDESIAPGTAEFRQGDKTLGRITGIAASKALDAAAPAGYMATDPYKRIFGIDGDKQGAQGGA